MTLRRKWMWLGASSSVFSASLCVLLAQSPRFDIILRHGTVVDGTGLPRYRADVGIAGDRVARVGDLSSERAATDIDVTGLFVAPGFINIHSHASVDALTSISASRTFSRTGVRPGDDRPSRSSWGPRARGGVLPSEGGSSTSTPEL